MTNKKVTPDATFNETKEVLNADVDRIRGMYQQCIAATNQYGESIERAKTESEIEDAQLLYGAKIAKITQQ